jgi:poly(3-hydroxybutyrate) depolymerase
MACTGASDAVAPAQSVAASEPVSVDLEGLPLTPGPAEATVSVDGQGGRDIAVWMPEGPGPHPLALFLHGGGGGDGLIDGLLGCLVEPALAPLSPIIVAPRNARGQWWLEQETAFVLGLVQAAHATWSIEPSRSVVLGYSNGGIGTWLLARERPELFGAAIPMAASVSFIGPTPLPVYAIAGEEDELFAFDEVSRAIEQLIADGQDVTLDAKPGGSHFEACEYVPELEAAREWLTASVWAVPD